MTVFVTNILSSQCCYLKVETAKEINQYEATSYGLFCEDIWIPPFSCSCSFVQWYSTWKEIGGLVKRGIVSWISGLVKHSSSMSGSANVVAQNDSQRRSPRIRNRSNTGSTWPRCHSSYLLYTLQTSNRVPVAGACRLGILMQGKLPHNITLWL